MSSVSSLLPFIRCPVCTSDVLSVTRNFLRCERCKETYPIIEDIPVLVNKRQQVSIRSLWNKEESFSAFDFETTPKVASIIQQYATESSYTLDIGCGVGAYQKHMGGTVISFDYIPFFVRKARKTYNGKNKFFLIADATVFPFRDRSFDNAICSQVIEHLKPAQGGVLLKNIIRVVRKNAIIDTPNDGNRFIRFIRSLLYPEIPNALYGNNTDTRMLHHSVMSASLFRKHGYSVHACIGYVTRNRFRFTALWDIYDSVVWNVPELGGNLVAIYNKR